MSRRRRTAVAVVLLAGVLVPGLADALLSRAGYETLGLYVWAVGYLGTALVVWFVWLRPLDIGGG